MTMANGRVIWAGKSLLDGQSDVVVVAVLASSNGKTGDMVQTYILRADRSPVEAVRDGTDSAICGVGEDGCKHRGDLEDGKGRTCYVNIGQGPLIVWKTLMRGGYAKASEIEVAELGRGRMVRLGTYGDPAAVPAGLWRALVSLSVGHTGYTHQWRQAMAGELQALVMASCDSLEEARGAQAAGWRTFRVIFPGQQERQRGEALCPASEEAGRKLQCEQCGACSGTGSGRKGSVAILAHGGTAVMANVVCQAAN
jgi:hypothetical protein